MTSASRRRPMPRGSHSRCADQDRYAVHPGNGARGLSIRLVRDRRVRRRQPVFLISTMAEHTRNLQRDPRASLLVAESGSEDPLANGRVTLLGPCAQVEDGGGARAAFLATTRTQRTTWTSATSRSGS